MRHDLKTLLTAAVGLVMLAISSAAYGEVRLRSHIVVDSPDVTLGDLFDDAGAQAFVSVRSAPAPGERLVIRTRALQDFTRAKGLQWEAPPGLRAITVTRAGRSIPRQDLEAALRPELRLAGATGSFAIDLQTRDLAVKVPLSGLFRLEVDGLDFDRRTSRFSAALSVSGEDFGTRRVSVSGFARALIEVPVLTRRLGKGEIIRESDISVVQVAASSRHDAIVEDPESLVGLQAKRVLRRDQPVRLADVQPPVLVKKGSLVTMVVRTPIMRLSTIGQALEDGAFGDVVRVLNPKSHTTVQGTVVSQNEVQMITRGSVELARK